jgi:protein-S-isoprenylcysteine O-methyltransferase Ste14
VAVISAILGQSLLFSNSTVLIYGAGVWLAFHLFVVVYEEPKLRRTFGGEYEAFCLGVPRWVPRVSPWRG